MSTIEEAGLRHAIFVRSRNEGKRSREKHYRHLQGCSETKLKDAARKGRLQKLDDDILKAMVDSNPRQTIEELHSISDLGTAESESEV